ncbi:hypothetical protein V2J09_002514 [Rumex salicifolius]
MWVVIKSFSTSETFHHHIRKFLSFPSSQRLDFLAGLLLYGTEMMLQLKVIWHLFNLCAIAFAWTVHGSTGFSVFTSKDTFSSFPPVEEQNHAYTPSAAPFLNGSTLQPPLTSHGLESSPSGPELPSTPAVSPTQSAVAPSPTVPFRDTTTSQQSAPSPKPFASLPPDVPLHDLAPQKPTQALAPHTSTPSQASVPIHVPNPASNTVPLPPVKPHTSVPLPPVMPPVPPLHSHVMPPPLLPRYAYPPSIVAMPSRTTSALSPNIFSYAPHTSTTPTHDKTPQHLPSPSPLLQIMPLAVPSHDSASSPTLPPDVFSPPRNLGPSHSLAPPPQAIPSDVTAPPHPSATLPITMPSPVLAPPPSHLPNFSAPPPIVLSSPPEAPPSHDMAPPPKATISEHSLPPLSFNPPIQASNPPSHAIPPIVSSPPPESHFSARPPNSTIPRHFSALPPTPATNTTIQPRDAAPPTVPLPPLDVAPPSHDVASSPPTPSIHGSNPPPTVSSPPPDAAPSHDLASSPTGLSHFSAPLPNATVDQQSSAPPTPATHASNPPPDVVPPTVSSPPPDVAPSHDLAPSPTAVSSFSAPLPNATIAQQSSAPPTPATHVSNPPPDVVPPTGSSPPLDVAPSHDLAPSPTGVSSFSAPPPSATIGQQSSAPPTPATHVSNPPPDAVPPTRSSPPPDAAPSHDLAPSPTGVSSFSASPPNVTIGQQSSAPPTPATHASNPPPDAIPPTVSLPPPDAAPSHDLAPSPTVVSHFSPPPPNATISPQSSAPPPSTVAKHAPNPPPDAVPPTVSLPPPDHAPSHDFAPSPTVVSHFSAPPTSSATSKNGPLAAPPVRSPSVNPVLPREPPSIAPEAQLPHVSSPAPSIDHKGDRVPVPVAAPSGPTYTLSPTNYHPEQGFSPSTAPSIHKPRGMPSLAPISTFSPAPKQQGSSEAMAPAQSPLTKDDISPVPMSAVPVTSGHSMTPFLSPEISPSAKEPIVELAPPILALPPPPPNQDCLSYTCLEPYTNTIPGSPCGCVLPMKVELRIGVDLYTFFPLVPELAREIATGIFMKQSQVRIMGANAASDKPDKTLLLIDLVPLGDKFDNITALLIFERFWNKQVNISKSLFGDYEVLYVQYPGLPASPPMAPSDVAAINGGPYPGENGSKINPLGVDVRNQGRKHRLSGSLIAIIVLSAVGVMLMGLLLGWILLFRHRRHTNQLAEAPHVHPSSIARSTGPTGQSAGSRPSFSLSLESSVAAYTGSAKTFSAVEIERATDNFNPSRVLGEGGFGLVYSATLEDGAEVAVKVLKREDQQGGREFLAEIEMLSRLHHRNLVKLIGICAEEHIHCLIYELIPNGSVEYVAPEYAMTGHLLVKSDVYSYGVVLLELLTGRKPVDMSQPSGQENLVSWTRPYLTTKEALKSIVDPNLGPNISFDSVAKVAAIASMCVQPEVSHRPFMGEVVQALKLVCNECDDDSKDDSSRSENEYHEARDRDVEKALSVSDVLSGTGHGLGCKESGSDSFRRHSSSGPIGGGRSWRFWKRGSTTSSRDDVGGGENGLYRFWSGSH